MGGDISVPVDLQLSSSVDETVYFHNLQNTADNEHDQHWRRLPLRSPDGFEQPTVVV